MEICRAEAHLRVDIPQVHNPGRDTIFLGYVMFIYQPLHGSEPGSFPATWGLLAKWQRDLRSCNYYLGLELDPEKGVLHAKIQLVGECFSEEEPRGSSGSWKGRGSSQQGLEGE